MGRRNWVKVPFALLLVLAPGCSLDEAPAPVQKLTHDIGHGIAVTGQKVGHGIGVAGHKVSDGLRNRVVPGIRDLASRNPLRSDKDKNPAPGKLSTQFRRVKPSEMRTPGHYYLYDLYSDYHCPGVNGDQSSFVSAMFIDTVTPAAYNMGNTCADGNPIPATEFPYDIQQAWLGPLMKRHLVVYRSRIWNLELEEKKAFKKEEKDDSFLLCENDKQDLSLYVMRSDGRFWGFVGWKEPGTDANGKPEPRYRTTRFFPVEAEFRESTMVNVKSTNGAMSGRIMTARSPQGTHPGTFHLQGVEGIPSENQYAPMSCTVGHLFHEGTRPKLVEHHTAQQQLELQIERMAGASDL